MQYTDLDRLRSIKTLPSLVAYLRDELDWPIDADAIEDVTFDYDPTELGFLAATAVHIKEVKQLRPLHANQPWGVFWINFEKKRLPVVMLRRALGHLAVKKRASANKAMQRAWHMHDLLFISACGEDHERAITFAHFSQDAESPGDLPILKVLGWDDGDTVLHIAEAHNTLVAKLHWPSHTADLAAWRDQWSSAFTVRHREVITTTEQLEAELAHLATRVRRRANTIIAAESVDGPIRRLYNACKALLIHDLTEDDFADMIAQTISYGLLTARLSRPAGVSVDNLVDMVPLTNPFLRELLAMFLSLSGRKGAFDFDELGIQDLIEMLNRANPGAVKADFGNRTISEDPVIHFYEHFLASYDRPRKIQCGVFYTPQSIVSNMVRSVHELLQTQFGIEDGLASTATRRQVAETNPAFSVCPLPPSYNSSHSTPPQSLDDFFVTILDPSAGTATFLVEVIEVVFQHLRAKWDKSGVASLPRIPAAPNKTQPSLPASSFADYWQRYVPNALFPRLYGYELMMAPYTIAHEHGHDN